MSTGSDVGVESMPPTRLVRVTPEGLLIKAKSRDGMTQDWTVAPIPFPEGCDSSTLVIHAAFALEWSVDIIVGFRADSVEDRVELWRVGPWGFRARSNPFRTDKGVLLAPITRVLGRRPWNGTVTNGQRQCLVQVQCTGLEELTDYVIRTDALRFESEIRQIGISQPRRFQIFISYKDKDASGFARQVNDYLKRLEIETWFAPDQKYVDYEDAIIRRGIENSDHFLLILSENSFDLARSGYDDGLVWHEEGVSTRRELIQEAEINIVRDLMATLPRTTRLFLADIRSGGGIPKELADNRWDVQTPKRAPGASDGPPDLNAFAADLAMLIAREINSLKATKAGPR